MWEVVQFSVENTRTRIYGADHFILHVLDTELRYPTQVSQAKESGIVLPDGDDGDGRGSWDGWVRLLRIPKTIPPWFPTGLLGAAKHVCDKFSYPVGVDDRRAKPELGFPEIVDIPLRDYQKAAVESALTSTGIPDGRGVFDMPPRSGKTRTMCELQRRLALPTVWLAPTDRIVRQTHRVLEGFFGRYYAAHLIGSGNESDFYHTKVVVCTAATAALLSPLFFKSRECIAIDEFHHGAAPSYRKILDKCQHIYYRYGMTGTFFRSGDDTLSMHALLSKTLFKITSLELLQRGYLVPSHTVFIPVPCPHLRGMPSPTFNVGHGKYGIHEHTIRNQLVAHAALLLQQMGRSALILVGTKKQGWMIRSILKALLPATPTGAEFGSVEFVSTDIDRKVQTRMLDSFEGSDEVKVLIGTSILGEGVDLPNADALVYARGEKAEVTLTQNMYRTGTATPGKQFAIVVDFADRHHRKLLAHAQERLRIYWEEPTFSVTVLQDPREFPGWLHSLVPKPGQKAL